MKLDIGSGSEDRWYWPKEETDVIRLDCDDYDGVTKWDCEDQMPVKDKSVDEAYLGQLLIETTTAEHKKLVKELNRIMKPSGKIIIHCYAGILGFAGVFKDLEELGWHVITDELVNFIDDEGEILKTYTIELERR